MWYEQKKAGNGVVGEDQGMGSSEEDEARVNDVAPDVNCTPGKENEVCNGLQIPQQQAQVPVICWEMFLPKRSLKVLLVENDDSTRHVVSALLRNCSYEVTAVSNGLQAWRILEDLTNPIDLILTEVVMPFVSGISLLYKIMSHKTLKTIPVIMMSSHDSMGIVFKCLSKGAVDFLVKPIRKNELKNLWQHVWRRCHSSSGSGSESGTQTKKSAQSKSYDMSDNDTGSSEEHDNGNLGLNIRDGSDNGSGTQSSWTKRAAEVDSPRPVSPWDQSADAPDSTCAQVIHTKPEKSNKRSVHVTETKESQEQDEQLDLDMQISRNSDLQHKYPEVELSAQMSSESHKKGQELDIKPFERGLLEPSRENLSGNMRDQTPDKNCAIENSTNPPAESRTFDAPPSSLSNIAESKKGQANCVFGEPPSLELTLNRFRGARDGGVTANDDRNVLRQSDLSAFTKYNTTSSANQGPTGNVGSCSPLENSSVAMKTETMQNFMSQSNSTPPNQQSNESSNNNDMLSTKYVTLKQEALNDKSESISAFKCFYSSAFQPVQNDRVCPPQQVTHGKADSVRVDKIQAKSRGSQQHFQVQHHHHYYHHFHHHVHNMQQNQLQPGSDDPTQKNVEVTAPQCGSSNLYRGPIEGNTGNYSVNGSASGSNHGSNGQYGNSTALNGERINIKSDNGAAGNSGAGGISGKLGANGMDEDRIAQREAALTKFRQKRKDRCFEKKVRYQSRKRLAEQRPRIRGQFVRQMASDVKSAKDDQNNDLMSEDNSCDSVQ